MDQPTPQGSTDRELSDADARELRLIGRRTWRFFETFVTAEDHSLPPDNYQEEPDPVVAHRTSPTNIGMYLLATVTARDMGWIGTHEMAERLEATLATVGRLERLRGHLYNWYDTRDLRPLEPAYLSSVDSGNLCGHLLALSNACREMLDQPLPVATVLAGIDDAIQLTRQSADAIGHDRRSEGVTRRDLDDALEPFAESLHFAPTTPGAWVARVNLLSTQSRTLVDVARAFVADRAGGAQSDLVTWAEAAQRTVSSHARDLEAIESTVDIGGSEVTPTMAGPGVPASVGPGGSVAQPGVVFPTLLQAAGPDMPAPGDVEPAAVTLVRSLGGIADEAQRLFRETDFQLLFVPSRKLFSIGFRVRDGSLDSSCYDLLASEARLTSFLAIAKGDVDASHWFRLGRPLTPIGRGSALVSWSGSMFEYLMPALVMRAPMLSLLGHTYRLVVARQISTLPTTACLGASRNRGSTRVTSRARTSTPASACRGSA